MTNTDIILGAMRMYKVTEDVDTYAGWQRNGYQVKHGEHAVFKTKIWKPVKSNKPDGTETETDNQKLILVNASFFTRSQVEETK